MFLILSRQSYFWGGGGVFRIFDYFKTPTPRLTVLHPALLHSTLCINKFLEKFVYNYDIEKWRSFIIKIEMLEIDSFLNRWIKLYWCVVYSVQCKLYTAHCTDRKLADFIFFVKLA